MRINRRNINQNYFNLVILIYFVFIFGVFSFGRAFLILHVNVALFPIFITESFMLITFPFLLLHYKELFKFPKSFYISFVLFIILGLSYLFIGVFNHNLFVLRDIVLCVYCLFLPLTYLIFFNPSAEIPGFQPGDECQELHFCFGEGAPD